MESATEAVETPELPVHGFSRDVLHIYRHYVWRHYVWLFMEFLIPATFFGYVAVTVTGGKAQHILRSVTLGPEILQQGFQIVVALPLRLTGRMVSCIMCRA